MLAPEVWSMVPTNNVNSYDENLKVTEMKQLIKSFHYCHSMVILTPDDTVRTLLSDIESDSVYYKIMDLDISELFSPYFIKYFLNEGKITMLSDQSSIEFDNSFAVVFNECVILKLRRDVYVQLGVKGKPSLYTPKKTPDFYVIQIDLKKLKDCDKRYFEYKQRFSDFKLKFDCFVSWEPNDFSKCPSSIAFYFTNMGYRVRSCRPVVDVWNEYNVKWPLLNSTNVEDLIEWISAFVLQIKMPSSISSNFTAKMAELLKVRGFFSEEKIATVFSLLRTHIMNNKHIPWIGLYVHGFDDTPVSLGLEEHCINVNGDNGFIVFIKSTGLCNVYTFRSKRNKNTIVKV